MQRSLEISVPTLWLTAWLDVARTVFNKKGMKSATHLASGPRAIHCSINAGGLACLEEHCLVSLQPW
jgi:hypothetical protein